MKTRVPLICFFAAVAATLAGTAAGVAAATRPVGAITTLARARNGGLTTLRDGSVNALGESVRSFVLSRDGRNAYVATDRSVVKLDRNRSTGRLVLAPGYHGCHQRRTGCPVLRGVVRAD